MDEIWKPIAEFNGMYEVSNMGRIKSYQWGRPHILKPITRTGKTPYVILSKNRHMLQNHKSLLPYGYPFAYVENIHHQYILIFRKGNQRKKKNGI